jgi:hypothetical protein
LTRKGNKFMQWKNPDGSITNGAVIEDGAGNKLGTAANPLNVTGISGGGSGSNASVGATGSSVPASATAAGYKNPAGNLVIAALTASGGVQVDGSGVTQPISAAALPLPAGAATALNQPSLVATSAGAASREVISDPLSGAGALVQPFHNADNQTIPSTSNGLMTGGVAQLVNSAGNLNRQRETGFDGVPAAGVAAGAQQLAGPLLSTTMTSGAIGASTSAQTVTLAQSGLAWTNRGVLSTVQVGTEFLVDAGLSTQEIVFVSAFNASARTITAVFSKAHGTGATFATFTYNQARDATISDGSAPAGIAASAAYFYNPISQTIEIERSAAGELDGATGTGAAIAAEYGYNGGGPFTNAGAPSGLAFDRARNLQGKGAGGSTLSGAIAAGATSIALNAVVGLTPGAQIRFDRALGTEECGYVSQSYVPGNLTVGLQSALANGHALSGTVDWDVFAASGPGLNGFTATGIGIEEAALYDPVSDKYYIERAATQDGVSAQNVVLEAPGLWNGSTFDRWREGAVTGSGLVSPVDNATGSATVSATGVLTGFPLNTAGYGKITVFVATSSLVGILVFEGSNDGWVTSSSIYAGNITPNQLFYSATTSVSNPAAGQVFEFPLEYSSVRVRCSVYASGTATVQWNTKASGQLYRAQTDQGAPGILNGAWFQRLTDGTNGPAAVKPASTAAAATDPALVVALSPNSPLPEPYAGIAGAAGNIGGTFAITAAGQSVTFNTQGFQSMLVEVTLAGSGTYIIWEGSNDNWATAYSVVASRMDTLQYGPASGQIGTFSAGTLWEVPTKFAQMRLRCPSYTNPVTLQYSFKAGPVSRSALDQGAAGSYPWLVAAQSNGVASTNSLTQLAAAIAPATPAATAIKASAGRLYLLDIGNAGAADVWVKLFNVAVGSVTLGTTPATTNLYVPKGTRQQFGIADIGDYFSTAITYAVTGGISLTDNTAITASTVTLNARYA